jgi:hypothetical protein
MTVFFAASAAGPAITSTDSKEEDSYSSSHSSETGLTVPAIRDKSRKTTSFGLAVVELRLSEID